MKNVFIKTSEQKKWLEKVTSFEEEFMSNSLRVDEEAIFPTQNIQQLQRIGYTGITLPKAYGGQGLGVYEMVLLQETLASFDSNTALSIGWNLGVIGELFEKNQWQGDQLALLAGEVTKGALINRSVSESQTGSPTRGGRPGTTAVKEHGSWIINGRKTFTTASPVLSYFLTSAWIEEKQQVGFFLLHRDLPGLSIEETWDMVAMRGTASHDLVLEDCRIEGSKLVELVEKPSVPQFSAWLLHIPACYLGVAQAARDYAVHFSTTHQPNSLRAPISELPNVQQLLGEIDLALIQARHLIYSVAEIYDDEKRRPLLTNEVAVVKHTVTNSAITIVDKAMRIVGAKSLEQSNPLQRHYRDVRAGLHNPPMDDMTLKRLAQAAINQK